MKPICFPFCPLDASTEPRLYPRGGYGLRQLQEVALHHQIQVRDLRRVTLSHVDVELFC